MKGISGAPLCSQLTSDMTPSILNMILGAYHYRFEVFMRELRSGSIELRVSDACFRLAVNPNNIDASAGGYVSMSTADVERSSAMRNILVTGLERMSVDVRASNWYLCRHSSVNNGVNMPYKFTYREDEEDRGVFNLKMATEEQHI